MLMSKNLTLLSIKHTSSIPPVVELLLVDAVEPVNIYLSILDGCATIWEIIKNIDQSETVKCDKIDYTHSHQSVKRQNLKSQGKVD